jgi:hypothetical protein
LGIPDVRLFSVLLVERPPPGVAGKFCCNACSNTARGKLPPSDSNLFQVFCSGVSFDYHAFYPYFCSLYAKRILRLRDEIVSTIFSVLIERSFLLQLLYVFHGFRYQLIPQQQLIIRLLYAHFHFIPIHNFFCDGATIFFL